MTEDGNPIFLTFRLAMSLGIIPFCNTISGIVAIYTNRCMNSLLSGKIKQDEKVERNEKDEVLMIGVEVPVTTLPFSPDVNVPFSATSNAPLVNVVESPSTPAAPLAEIEDSSEDADEEVPQFRNLNDGDPENRRPTHQKTDSEFTIRPVSHRPPPITNRVAIPYPQEIPEEAFMAQGSFVYGGVMSGGADKPGDMGVLQEISDISHSISGKLGKGLTESDTSISISKGVANAGQNNVQSVSPKDSVKSNKTIEKKHIEPGFESDPVENISAKSSKGDLAEESASPPNPGIAPSESSKDLPFKSSSKPDLNESSPIAITTMVPSESTKSLVKSSSKPNIAPAPELNLKNSSVIVIKPEANDIFTGIVPSTSTKSLTRPASKPDIIQAPLLESENGNTASSKLQNLKDVLEVPPPPALDYTALDVIDVPTPPIARKPTHTKQTSQDLLFQEGGPELMIRKPTHLKQTPQDLLFQEGEPELMIRKPTHTKQTSQDLLFQEGGPELVVRKTVKKTGTLKIPGPPPDLGRQGTLKKTLTVRVPPPPTTAAGTGPSAPILDRSE